MAKGDDRFRRELLSLVPRLRRFGHALTGSIADGDDLLQDALEKALKREHQFELGTRLDSWMFTIMRTTWIDTKRADSRRIQGDRPLTEDLHPMGEDGRRSLTARATLNQVRSAMTALNPDERAVLALVSLEGFTYREAADALAIPIGTVMSRVARARRNLLSLVEGPGEPEATK